MSAFQRPTAKMCDLTGVGCGAFYFFGRICIGNCQVDIVTMNSETKANTDRVWLVG